jgi:hypothetical protein
MAQRAFTVLSAGRRIGCMNTVTPPSLSLEERIDLAWRYVDVWNENNDQRRRERIRALWRPDGVHYVRTLVAQGYDALEERVASSHDKNVRQNGYHFRLSGEPQQLQDALLMHWDMVRPGIDTVEAYGAVFMVLAEDGRIAADYQFMLPTRRG